MCIAVPAELISTDGIMALADCMGIRKEINVQLIEDPVPGDFVLLHAGFAIQKIDAEYRSFLLDTYLNCL